ncbi:MAG: Rdx family protein [Chloroflexi bacterium]|nr:Rdx family protein [Chloroflexota bacterium]
MTGLLLNKCQEAIQELTLIPSDGGKFEVSVNGNLVYSKLATGRHADPSEVLDAVNAII